MSTFFIERKRAERGRRENFKGKLSNFLLLFSILLILDSLNFPLSPLSFSQLCTLHAFLRPFHLFFCLTKRVSLSSQKIMIFCVHFFGAERRHNSAGRKKKLFCLRNLVCCDFFFLLFWMWIDCRRK